MKTESPAKPKSAPAKRGRARSSGIKPDAEFSVFVVLPGGFNRTVKVRARSEEEAAEKAGAEAWRLMSEALGGASGSGPKGGAA